MEKVLPTDSPSKSLIIYVSEGIQFSQDTPCPVQHLSDQVVSRGCTGIGVYSDDPMSGEEQFMRSFRTDSEGGQKALTIYKNNVVTTGFVTCEDHAAVLEKSQIGRIQRIYTTKKQIDSVDSVAEKILHALYSRTHDESDMVLVTAGPNSLGWTNDLIQRLDAMPGFLSNVFLCLVVECIGFDILKKEKEHVDSTPDLSLIRPPQSFMFRGTSTVSIDCSKAAVYVYRLPGSTRIDTIQSITDIDGIYSQGGGKCIQIERIMYEVAYKVGHSLKYGA